MMRKFLNFSDFEDLYTPLAKVLLLSTNTQSHLVANILNYKAIIFVTELPKCKSNSKYLCTLYKTAVVRLLGNWNYGAV